jgi:hypothetical protein
MKRYLKRDALIPRLARDLARQLEGHEADPVLANAVREVQAHYKSKFEPITAEQFENTLRLIARGARTQCFSWGVAVVGSDISPANLHKYLADPELRRQFDEARRHWKQYREWGVLEIEEILDDLARGERTLQSLCYARGFDRNKYLRLLYLIGRSPEVEQRYHLAKKAQFARTGDRLFEDLGEVSTKKEARAICRRMHLARIRMPKKIREVFHRERTPLEAARRRAGLRLSGKPKREQEETT